MITQFFSYHNEEFISWSNNYCGKSSVNLIYTKDEIICKYQYFILYANCTVNFLLKLNCTKDTSILRKYNYLNMYKNNTNKNSFAWHSICIIILQYTSSYFNLKWLINLNMGKIFWKSNLLDKYYSIDDKYINIDYIAIYW